MRLHCEIRTMSLRKMPISCMVIVCIVLFGFSYVSQAKDHKGNKGYHGQSERDRDEYSEDSKNRKRNRFGREDRSKNTAMNPVTHVTYKEECGSCHFAYQPELLPSESWSRIVNDLENHFGNTVQLDDRSRAGIMEYLTSNAAEKSSAKRSVKIMKSLGNQTPVRITEIPYIREKHRKIQSNVLKRPSIGSLSNCSACHTTAESGNYDDDYVVIPE